MVERTMEIKEIKEICDSKGLNISVSESLTSGKIQDQLASISGSSTFFVGGVTVYNIDQKSNLLGVNYEHANEVNCVSQRVADEMAMGCNELFGSDISISVTGYASPYGDVTESFCYYSIYNKGEKLIGDRIDSPNDENERNENREYFTSKIIKSLYEIFKTL